MLKFTWQRGLGAKSSNAFQLYHFPPFLRANNEHFEAGMRRGGIREAEIELEKPILRVCVSV